MVIVGFLQDRVHVEFRKSVDEGLLKDEQVSLCLRLAYARSLRW